MDKTSNVGDPGFWIYEVKQDLSKPAIRGPPKEIATFCGNGGEAIPSVIPMYMGPGKGLRLTPCLETLFPMEVSLRLVGKSFEKMIDATVEEDDFRYIKADVPELWGSNEAVSVHVISNGDDIQTPIELYFSGEQFDSNKLHITETSSEKSELRVEWPKVTLTGETDLEIREYSFSEFCIDFFEHFKVKFLLSLFSSKMKAFFFNFSRKLRSLFCLTMNYIN